MLTHTKDKRWKFYKYSNGEIKYNFATSKEDMFEALNEIFGECAS